MKARESSNTIDKLRLRVQNERVNIGAIQSRLGIATSALSFKKTALLEASSQIQDADIAEESAKLVANSIIQNAAAAILSQANQQNSLALKLLSLI